MSKEQSLLVYLEARIAELKVIGKNWSKVGYFDIARSAEAQASELEQVKQKVLQMRAEIKAIAPWGKGPDKIQDMVLDLIGEETKKQ